MKTFVASCIAVAVSAQDPEAPVWSKTFVQTFDEIVKYPVMSKKTTKGTYYYDVSDVNNTLTRIDRDNGRWDRYCGLTHHLSTQPCR